jgi:N-acetylgalactosamine-N,N'-diacetylbacillosaminyl-diphospho-undecaprenol 4-alpha-N-acetylgalactosaminyltransferase
MRGRLNKLIVRALYPRANRTVAVSRDVEQDLVENHGIPATKAITIGNPIDVDLIEKRSKLDAPFALPAEFVVGAGRLVPNKNFGLLIEAYRRSAVALPLVIMGDGPERGALANQVDKLGLGGRVIFPGYVANPYPVVRRAKFFVSSSNAEGFPNALVEAMALGCAVVATDCNAGPSEILNHTSSGLIDRATLAKYGVLVPTNDSEALAAGMHMMMDDAKRASLAGIARRRALDFRPDIVVKRYAELLAASLPHLTSPEPAKADALKAG